MDTSCEPSEAIRIFVAAAVRLYREGLIATLTAQNGLRVVGTAGISLEVEAGVRELHPDVVIVDVSMIGALQLIRGLRTESLHKRILAFAMHEDVPMIVEYARAGADGFVTMDGSTTELIEAIRRTAAGELLCSPRITAELLRFAVERTNQQQKRILASLLTSREQQVFLLLKQGRSNKEIAKSLCISEATVKNHVHHVLEKLQLTRRSQVAAENLAPSRPPKNTEHFEYSLDRR